MNPRLTEHLLTSELLTAPRRAWVHHEDSARDCLIFLDGELYTERVMAPEVLATARASGSLPPLTCVYLPNLSAVDRHAIYTCDESYAAFIALEMPRWIEGIAGRFERLFLCGLSLSALQSTYTALRHPHIFAGVLAQSCSVPLLDWTGDKLTDLIHHQAQIHPAQMLCEGVAQVSASVASGDHSQAATELLRGRPRPLAILHPQPGVPCHE